MSAPPTDLRGLDLLDAAIEHIEKHPETWVQGEYRCGSGQCLAGWIGQMGGGQWAASGSDWRGEYMLAEPEDPLIFVERDSDYGEIIHVAERAERLIGVSRYVDGAGPRDDLFGGGNTLDDIKALRGILRARAVAS